MAQTRNAALTVTTTYQKVGTLISAVSGAFTERSFSGGFFFTPASETNSVRISIVLDGATTGSDGLSNLLAPGKYWSFEDLDLNYVWLKSVGGTSTIEFSGTEES